MIAASLIAIAIVSGLLFSNQIKLHKEKIRVHGVALTRAMSNVELPQLVANSSGNSLMRSLVNVQDNEDFAYTVVVNLAGEKLLEDASAGSIPPAATMPKEPYAWFGEHTLVSPGDARQIREFFAPIMEAGQLAGFVRAGYYNNPTGMLASQLSNFALMALPIFLLTALSYFLIRREIKPLGLLSKKMEQASLTYGIQIASPAQDQNLSDFMQRFDQFMRLVQSKNQQMNTQVVATQTNTHLLSYKQEKAESALNSIPDAILVLDQACLPTFANSKIETMLGISREAIIGKRTQEWCEQQEVLTFLQRFENNPAATFSSAVFVPIGQPDRRISMSAYPLFSPRDQNTLFGMLILFRDVSKEHLAKQAGVEFVAHVSHELKTPLSILAAHSELLLDYSRLTENERVDAVNVIHDETERMAGLINNLLNISKMEAGTLQLVLKRVKLHDLLQDAFDSMNHNALGKGVELELKIPPDMGSIRLDKDLFRIAIDNLLSNAIKYSNAGGKVTLSAQTLEDNQTKIVVRDRGIGISPEDCGKVFQKHYRANNSETTTRSGHGLGLYLAKQIVELHHGTIAVESEPGRGSEFIVMFKAQTVQLEESQTT